jgi:AraC-like DNA-binding protein
VLISRRSDKRVVELSKHLILNHLPGLLRVEYVHDRPLLLWSDGPLTIRTRAGIWTVPLGRVVWLTAWTRFRLDAPGRVRADVLLLNPDRARTVVRPSAVLETDALLAALVRQAAGPASLRAGVAADRRLFNVLLDRIGAASSLPMLVRTPLEGRLAGVVSVGTRSVEGHAPSITDLAASLGASRKTVERAFAREVGLTVGRWRQQIRFTRAVALLSEGRRVGDVAREVGYRTPSAFVAAFRKAMGATPRRFVRNPGQGTRQE